MSQPGHPVNPYAAPHPDSQLGYAAVVDPKDPNAKYDRLGSVKTGLQLVYWGIVLILVTVVIGVLFAVVNIADENQLFDLTTINVLVVVAVGAVLLGALLQFVGQCFCLGAPADSSAKEIVAASIGLQVLQVIVAVGFGAYIALAAVSQAKEGRVRRAAPRRAAPRRAAAKAAPVQPVAMGALQIVNSAFGGFAFLCMLTFLDRIGNYIEQAPIVRLGNRVRAIFIAVFVISLAINLITMVPAGAKERGLLLMMGAIAAIAGLVLLVLFTIVACMYTTLLREIITAIRERRPPTFGAPGNPPAAPSSQPPANPGWSQPS